jgi:hypothetical protein
MGRLRALRISQTRSKITVDIHSVAMYVARMMFDREQAIARWRRQMIAGGIKMTEVLDELESHLREDLERQVQSGLSAERAFEVSVQQIGQAGLLKREFAKVGRSKWTLFRKLKAVFVGYFDQVPSMSALTPSARQALELARTEAPRLNHNFIGTEHVLLGLLAVESGVVPNVLKRMKIDRENLRRRVEDWISIFPPQKTLAHIPYTPRVKKALSLALNEAKACNRDLVGAEHVFLGLMLEGDGVAGRVLRNLGLSIEKTRREILREMDGAA